MPTEQINRYFQDASTEALVRTSGIVIADAIVVASIATHISATLFAVTAMSIVSANAFWKTRKRRVDAASPVSSAPRPGPNPEARSDTSVMHTVRSADRASTRQTSPAGGANPFVSTCRHNQMLAANDTALRPTLVHPTNGR